MILYFERLNICKREESRPHLQNTNHSLAPTRNKMKQFVQANDEENNDINLNKYRRYFCMKYYQQNHGQSSSRACYSQGMLPQQSLNQNAKYRLAMTHENWDLNFSYESHTNTKKAFQLYASTALGIQSD